MVTEYKMYRTLETQLSHTELIYTDDQTVHKALRLQAGHLFMVSFRH